MRHVPITEFQNDISTFVAAAEAGEDVIVTQDGRDLLKLTRTEDERMARQRAAVQAAYAFGQEIKAKYGPTSAAEIREWIEEGRR